MIWSLHSSEADNGGGFLGFLRRAAAAAMGCFFGCFRANDSHTNIVPRSDSNCVESRKRISLSSLLLSEGTNDTPQKNTANKGTTTPELEGLDFKGLKDQAKFLKACGTLPKTPVEIRKASKKWEDASFEEGEGKLNLDKPSSEPLTPVKVSKENETGAGSFEDTPSSCMTDGPNSRRLSTSPSQSNTVHNIFTTMDPDANEAHSCRELFASPAVPVSSVKCTNKSVRFACESDISTFLSKGSSAETDSENSKQSGRSGYCSVSKPSPYPTPLKLSDEMQTPGTVFPAYLNNMADGRTRIRSQYVYSVPKPVEDSSDWKVLKGEDSNSNNLSQSLEEVAEATPDTYKEMNLSTETELKAEASLSAWIKQPSVNQNAATEQLGSTRGQNDYCGKTPGDRPIIGMVAAHWKEDETSQISPKSWDGNGIPNSTNKYKEDQKVSWHATPFEERLEKALSEESFIFQRKHITGPGAIEFNETEESDTALSHVQSSPRAKSDVSFR